jgi:NADH:ubiquinone oxidoreductase subunit 6 (subunit J)
MGEVFFFLFANGAITGAVGVIAVRNPFYSVLALVGHLISLAMLFLLLRAEFVAAAQVIVYAGAVMVLYVFVVSYVGGSDEPLGVGTGRGFKLASIGFAAALFLELCIAILGSGLKAIDSEGAGYVPGFGSPQRIGELLLTDFLLPFEVASFLLLIAAVGAVTLARRRGGLETPEEMSRLTALDVVRPKITGTMAEGVGGRRRLEAAPAEEEITT